jgi:excisionase family DNA binding protein
MKKYWSTKELAEELEVHQSTVNRWIQNNKIKVAKTPGGQNKIPLSEVDRFKSELGYDLEKRS